MTKLNPKAIIFDLGSTLIDYPTITWDEVNGKCAANSRRFLVERGYQVPPEEEFYRAFESAKHIYRRRAFETLVEWDVPMVARQLFADLNIPYPEDQIDSFFDAYYQPVAETVFVYPDTLDALSQLRSRRYTIGLISNTVFPERTHRGELKHFGIEPFLDFAIFSSTLGIRKPHPGIFLKACELARRRPEECVYIGDRYLEDVIGPSAIGMPAILKMFDGREYPPMIPESTRIIKSLSGLFEHLQKSVD
jgi:putative hydrolase of the HAD superfamily